MRDPEVEFHHRLKNVGYQACHYEREKHSLQDMNKIESAHDADDRENDSHDTVKRIGTPGVRGRFHSGLNLHQPGGRIYKRLLI